MHVYLEATVHWRDRFLFLVLKTQLYEWREDANEEAEREQQDRRLCKRRDGEEHTVASNRDEQRKPCAQAIGGDTPTSAAKYDADELCGANIPGPYLCNLLPIGVIIEVVRQKRHGECQSGVVDEYDE